MINEQMNQEEVNGYGDASMGEVDEKTKSQVDAFSVVLMNVMHSEQMAGQTMKMLSAGQEDGQSDPYLVIPKAAVTINDMAVNMMAETGEEVGFDVQLAGSSLLMNDLIQLGYANNLWPKMSQEEIAAVYEDTVQVVIERGLKDGSIDPIQLQVDAEKAMNPDQKRMGDALAQENGMEVEPSNASIMEQHAVGRERSALATKTKQDAKQKQSAMQEGVDERVQ